MIDAAGRPFVSEGASAVVNIDSIGDTALGGSVSFIGSEARTERGVVSYAVRIRVEVPAGIDVPVSLSAASAVIKGNGTALLNVGKGRRRLSVRCPCLSSVWAFSMPIWQAYALRQFHCSVRITTLISGNDIQMQNLLSRLFRQEAQPIDRLTSPVQRFAHLEAAGGIVLMIATVVAISLANSPFDNIIGPLTESHFVIGMPDVVIDKPLHFWINDALMAVFFFVVGLEIKRSLFLGELASVRQAALPIFAAAGGMIVPAAVYLLFNNQGEAARGWAIPMSTDIAFSLGILALLGTRAPLPLKAFLTAFAIVDDIGAIVVIAVFFTETISWYHLFVAAAMLGLLGVFNLLGVRNILVYVLVSIVIWVSFFESGIHPTISGVLIAWTIPLRVRIEPGQFVARARALVDIFEKEGKGERRGVFALTTESQRGALVGLENLSKQVESPLQRLEHALHPWVAFVIVPVFALAKRPYSLAIGI